MMRFNEVEKETVLRALKHYLLQCEIWRDVTSIARGADDRDAQDGSTGMWALMVERLTACIEKLQCPTTALEVVNKSETHRLTVLIGGKEYEAKRVG